MSKEEKSVEEKAVQIGRDLGIPEDQIPDYEITEEKSVPDQQEVEASESEEKDERLGKTREDREAERTGAEKPKFNKLTTAEKRAQRKRRIEEKLNSKDSLIREQQEQINALIAQMNNVNGKLSSFDRGQMENAIRSAQINFSNAEREYLESFNAGDGAKAAQAMRSMYEAQRRLEQLQESGQRQPAQQVQQPAYQQPVVKDRVIRKAEAWAEKNEWFDPNGGDEDSVIANTVASRLVQEGYEPGSDDYWEELDDRLARRGIGARDNDHEEEQTQSQQYQQEERKPQRRLSGVSSSSGRSDMSSGKVKISIPTALIDNMKMTGAWDDPARRNKVIESYKRTIAENNGKAR